MNNEYLMKRVCRDFMKNDCKREDCRYIHDPKLCSNFYRNYVQMGSGSCKFKDNCRKNHFTTQTERAVPHNSERSAPHNFERSAPHNSERSAPHNSERAYNDHLQRNSEQIKGRAVKTERIRPQSKMEQPVRKQKNTESWIPPSPPYDMQVQIEKNSEHLKCSLNSYDVLIAKSVFKDYQPNELHDKLANELTKCDLAKENLLKLWHGSEHRGIEGTHHIADDKLGWQQECPTFSLVINRLVDFFGVKPAATRFNWYKTHTAYKSFHFDSAYVNPEKAKTQNATICVSFGQSRDIVFENAVSKQRICIEQGDNDVYLFMNDINSTYRHGVGMGNEEERSSRISIVIWGWIEPRQTPNDTDVPSRPNGT